MQNENVATEKANVWDSLDDNSFLDEFGLTPPAGTPESTSPPTGKTASTASVGDAKDESVDEGTPALDAGEGEGGEEEIEAGGEEGEESAGAGEGTEKETPAPVEAAPAKQLAAEFQVFDAEGELEIPDLKLKFKANGEERELPLDRVVKLAQQGYYNEEREEEVREFREAVPRIEEHITSLQEQNQMLLEGWKRVLEGDDDYLEGEREQYFRSTSPEARAERAEAQLRAIEQSKHVSREEQQANQFAASLAPQLEAIEQAATEVSFEEIIGRFNLLTAPLMVKGVIPPTKFRDVERIIGSELRPWVEARQEERTKTKQSATASATSATAKTAALKRQVSRAVMPQGTHAAEAPKAAKKYTSATDILDDLQNIVGATGATKTL